MKEFGLTGMKEKMEEENLGAFFLCQPTLRQRAAERGDMWLSARTQKLEAQAPPALWM